jgi:hypothetical protein
MWARLLEKARQAQIQTAEGSAAFKKEICGNCHHVHTGDDDLTRTFVCSGLPQGFVPGFSMAPERSHEHSDGVLDAPCFDLGVLTHPRDFVFS